MKGFDEKFRTVPEYILGITREIWEDRGVGTALRRYYADNVLVRAANGMIEGNAGVAAATLQTLHEFPDRQLIGEDVIFNGGRRQRFFVFAQIAELNAAYRKWPAYGEATGKPVRVENHRGSAGLEITRLLRSGWFAIRALSPTVWDRRRKSWLNSKWSRT